MNHNLLAKAKEIRFCVVDMIYKAGDGHPGPSLGVVDIITALYFHEMNIDPKEPNNPERDRFIISKGHACPAFYAALAKRGYFSEEILPTLRQYNSILQGHPSVNTPGVDAVSGSLGNGISIGLGMEIARQRFGKQYYTYVLMGDGEMNEGVAWEGVIAAANHKAANLIVFVDNNGYQSGGTCGFVSGIEPFEAKFEAFGWHVQTINGNDINQILSAIGQAKADKSKPNVIITKTIKGKGVSFMENNNAWHKGVPSEEQWRKAAEELGGIAE